MSLPWSDPRSDPMEDVRQAVWRAASRELHARARELDALVLEAINMQDTDYITRLHIVYRGDTYGVASSIMGDDL